MVHSPLSVLRRDLQFTGRYFILLLSLKARMSQDNHVFHDSGSHVKEKRNPTEGKDDPDTCQAAIKRDVLLLRVSPFKNKQNELVSTWSHSRVAFTVQHRIVF